MRRLCLELLPARDIALPRIRTNASSKTGAAGIGTMRRFAGHALTADHAPGESPPIVVFCNRSLRDHSMGEAVVDACLVGDGLADAPTRNQTSSQAIKAVLRQHRITSPDQLRLVAGKGASQYTGIERREERRDRRR